MKNLGIGEVARRTGIATSTIRYYERIGLLPPSKRVSGKRRYDENILQKIGLIRLAKQAGLTIEEIQTLLYEFPVDTPPSARWTVLATKKITELDALIAQIQAMKVILEQTLVCECPTLDDCGVDELISN
jgi:MerR family transcriptional regulator, redox-sensitive transcriptional activator SoxR